MDIIDVDPDGNCYMRCIALFVYKKEDEHIRVKNEISNYLALHINEFENISIPTEVGMKSVYKYINYIRMTGKWSGHLEIYTTNILYNINVLCLINMIIILK